MEKLEKNELFETSVSQPLGNDFKIKKEWVACFDDEESFFLFLQDCIRMFWIEEHGNDYEYVSDDVTWIEKEHIKQLELMFDAMTQARQKSGNLSCYDLSDNEFSTTLDKKHYEFRNDRKVFLLWCYASKLALVRDEKDRQILSEYIRFMKKLLNHIRTEENIAWCYYDGPQRSSDGAYNVGTNYDRYFWPYQISDEIFFDLVKLNKEASLTSAKELFGVGDKMEEFKTSFVIERLEKEGKKQQFSPVEREQLRELEDYYFIKGLVDNFIDYDNMTFKAFCNQAFLKKLKDIATTTTDTTVRDVLEVISEHQISLKKCLVPVVAKWYIYTNSGVKYTRNCLMLPNNLYDLLTSENGIEIDKRQVKVKNMENFIEARMIANDGSMARPAKQDKRAAFSPDINYNLDDYEWSYYYGKFKRVDKKAGTVNANMEYCV